MTSTFQKICIYGAGAIGGWLAAGLSRTGVTVSIVARGDALIALKRDGLLLHSDIGTSQSDVIASSKPEALGVQDLVIIAVKAPALLSVAQNIAPLLHERTVVMTAMNGVPWWFLQGLGGAYAGQPLRAVDPTGQIAQRIPYPHLMGCVVHASCSLDEPGQVRHHFGNGLIVGEPSGETSARAMQLVQLLRTAGFDASLSRQIQKDIWYKLWGNLTLNPISALTGATTDKILDDPLLRTFISHVMLEAKVIGERLGLPITQSPEDRHAVTRKLGAFKTSMLQDVELRRPVELDALVSVVRELGLLTAVPTPLTDALLGLSRLHAKNLGLYPNEIG